MKKKWMVRAGALALGVAMLAGAAAVMPTNNANWLDGEAHADEELYTVTYDDGEPDVDIFEKQVYTDLHKGSTTPAFNGSPSWEGHRFMGWSPEIASTVDGDNHNIVYLASWSEDGAGTGDEDNGDEEDKTTFTVAYTDGTEDASIFGVQAHTGLKKGELTPAFNGTPEREGYTFAGWNPEVAATVSEDVTYVATWKEAEKTETKYTVTYTDGVSDAEIFKDQVYGDLEKDAKTPAFDGTPAREGYTFEGWNPAVAETVTDNVTYEAVWKAVEDVKYTVTYSDGIPDKEIFKDQSYEAKKGEKTPAYDGTPTREGYTFEGWNPAVAQTVTENVTYEAVWKAADGTKYKVTYTDGVTGTELFKDQVYEAKKGDKTPAYNGTPKRDGYIFEGWNPAVAETVSGNVTYEAVWKADSTAKYKITYTDGVTGAQLFKDQVYEAKKGDKTPAFNGTPKRTGYVFDGWNPSVSDTVTGNATYTAKWKAEGEIAYKVVYTDGVTGAELFKDQTYENLKKGDKTPSFDGTPTREGYTFNGWSPKVATNLDTAKADKDHVITYTATWKESKATGNSTTKTSGTNMRSDVNTGTTETVKTGEEDVVPFILGFMGVAAAAGMLYFYMKRRTAKN